jgi:DNA-binding GntR family transcriptional regulator
MSEQIVSRAEQMAGQILTLARREGMVPGDRLIEQRLADALDVSRGPVRLGLKALAAAGIATGAPNRGFVLAKSTSSAAARQAFTAAASGEKVYYAIASDRLQGRLSSDVTEAELMRRYGLNRTDTQRLLDRIAAEGWVARLPGYGWRFAETISGPRAHEQALAFRSVIEPAAILDPAFALEPMVIRKLRDRQLRMLQGELQRMSFAEIFQSGCEFHEEIARGAGNPFFIDALKRVNGIRRLFAYRTYTDRGGMERHMKQHLKLLDALEQRKFTEAARLMTRHLRSSPLTAQ